jgi:hypothetical protein
MSRQVNTTGQVTTGMRIHLHHVRVIDPASGPLCTPGIRAWCRQHDIDLHALASTGIDSDSRPDLHDDPFVMRILQFARRDVEPGDAS